MKKTLLSYFWNCGDTHIIEFALLRARLNKRESEVLKYILDDCLTQEEAAEAMNYSVRAVQNYWRSGTNKLLAIDWVVAYAEYLRKNSNLSDL